MLERESVPLVLADGREVAVLRVRDPRARRLRLLVSERGVRLTVPRAASDSEAQRFLASHRDWLAGQLARFAAATTTAPVLMAGETPRLPLRGEDLPVAWREGRFARVELAGDALAIQCPPRQADAALRRALKDFYLAQARADLGRWLPKYLPTLPRAPLAVRIRPLSSLWGSLSAAGALSLDLALVLGRPPAYEYVLVHELCHLIQPNHSRAFWREVEARFGDWRGERDYLRGEGLALKAALGRLVSAAS